MEGLSIAQLRSAALTEAFGDKGAAFESNYNELLKANFDAYKTKLTLTSAVFAKRAVLAKSIDKFWIKAMVNCSSLAHFLDPVDREALEHLEDVWIEHNKEDPRDFDVIFTFSPKNPYFKETKLVKKLTVQPPAAMAALTPEAYDLEADLYSSATTISWTSDKLNLCKKAPRVAVEELEENDEFQGLGSIFGWFTEEGEDKYQVGETFLEWWSHALEYAAGIASASDEEDDDGDEFDEDSDDGVQEIDLEVDERPKKRSKGNASK